MTAIAAWRLASTGRIAMPEPCELRSLRGFEARASELEGLPDVLVEEEGVVHVMVASRGDRRASRRLHCHLAPSRDLPEGALWRLGGDVLLPAPELCLVMLGASMGRIELLRLGMELCGRYRKMPDGASWWLDPLVSAACVRSFAYACRRVRGVRLARWAAQHLVDGAASPRESAIALMCVLPTKVGGYQLPHPVMNLPMELSSDARAIAGQARAAGDLYWPDHSILVEYDSDAAHATRRSRDMERRDGLESMGIRVLTITTEQVRDFDRLDACLSLPARRLRGRSRAVPSEARERRRMLHRELLARSPFVC